MVFFAGPADQEHVVGGGGREVSHLGAGVGLTVFAGALADDQRLEGAWVEPRASMVCQVVFGAFFASDFVLALALPGGTFFDVVVARAGAAFGFALDVVAFVLFAYASNRSLTLTDERASRLTT
jgi:hypothetical protein